MTDRPGQAPPSPVPATTPAPGLELPAAIADDAALARVRALCPHLVAADGDWRALTPVREHVCAAVDPPVPVAPDKQRRLCLVDEHVGCATYLAARSALVEDGTEGTEADAGGGPTSAEGDLDARRVAALTRPPRWPVPTTAPVVVDRGRGGLAGLRLDRSIAQVGLVGLMVLAFVVLAVARLSSDGEQSGAASPSPSVAASPIVTATPRPSPSPSAAPSASAIPSPGPSSSPAASATTSTRTYRVRSGDTLTGIAARFGTTVAVLRELNDIADPSLLRVGQVLRLP